MEKPEKPKRIRAYRRRAREKMKGFWDEFRDFAVKGDVVDLAVGVLIGAAFNAIVQSLVNDIIMPIFGKLLGNVAFSELYINLSDKTFSKLSEAKAAGAPVIAYGTFLTNILNFFIVALSLFVVLKVFFRHKREQENEEKK